jgi:putative hemolysin
MDVLTLEVLVILLLVLLNGFFALSEAAILTSRRSRLEFLASQGVAGAAQAVSLWENTPPFLSTVQLGITLLGVLAGAFGGATIARHLGPIVELIPGVGASSLELAFALVVLAITYLSIVAGELVPKRLALSNPERIAARIAPVMTVFSRVARPVVSVLNVSSSALLRLLGVREVLRAPVTEEEVRLMIDEGAASGLFARSERDMLSRVFRLGDYPVARFMVPRPDIAWIDLADADAEIVQKIRSGSHTRLPVCQDSLDNVIGYARVHDLLLDALSGARQGVSRWMKQPLFIPESMTALQALEELRRKHASLAIVVDEHGGTSGLVTTSGIAAAVLGDDGPEMEGRRPSARRQPDGSWIVDARLSIDEFLPLVGLTSLPEEERGAYHTVAGLVMHHLGRLPRVGDTMRIGQTRFRVLSMEGNRIDSLSVLPEPGP